MKNHLNIGPVSIRVGSKNIAAWSYPRLQIGGLSIWSWTNTGELLLAAYHPRSSITWLWSAGITHHGRGYARIFSKAERTRLARLFAAGNPYAFRPRWWNAFMQRDVRRTGQRYDYYRLPFGFALVIAQQDRMDRRA